MKSIVKKISESKREIEVEVDVEEVAQELKRIINQYSRRAKIPGFRPGKAPKDIVKRMFFPDIKESLINSLAPKALDQELKAQKLKPVSTPLINKLDFKEGEPFRFIAQFEVWPEVVLPEYKNIEVKKKKISVTTQDIDQYLEELRLKAAQYVPVVEGRGVVDGDYIIAEIQGRDTKTNKLLPKEKIALISGDAQNEQAVNEKLIGLKQGESCDFTLTYDADHQNKRLAGKEIEYTLTVGAIKERKIPEVNDDFAKDLGDYQDLKDLKAKLREDVKAQKESESRRESAQEIVKSIAEKISVELPESLVDQEYQEVMKRLISSRAQQGIKKEEVEGLKEEGRRKAEQNIKQHFILKKIAEEEKLDVSDEEVHAELKLIAKANNLPLAQVIDTFNKEGRRAELRNTLQIKKTVDFLVENAIMK